MGVEERTDLLKYNIARHMKDLLGLDFIEIRLLDRGDRPAGPAADRGDDAAGRQPRAVRPQGGQRRDRLRRGDRAELPLSRHDARPALPRRGRRGAELADGPADLPRHGHRHAERRERRSPNAFDDRDRQFLEIYARNVASALNTLELLQAEKFSTATASVEAISRELALPLDDILSDATTVLDRYAGHDEDIVARLRHLLYRAREIRSLIQKVGSTIAPEPKRTTPRPALRLAGTRLLVVDADESIRRSAHHLLGCQGATVETARDAHEAIALARQTPYSAALVDIRLPDLDGYETYKRLREVQPGVPIILMTGFGYDPSHSIVKARQEGLQTVLYKPFRADRLMEAVEQALRSAPAKPADGIGPTSDRLPAPTSDGDVAAAGEFRPPRPASMNQDWVFLALFAVGQAGSPGSSAVNVTQRSGFASGAGPGQAPAARPDARPRRRSSPGWPPGSPWPTWPWPASAYALVCLAIALVGLPGDDARPHLPAPARRGSRARDAEIDLAQRHGPRR